MRFSPMTPAVVQLSRFFPCAAMKEPTWSRHLRFLHVSHLLASYYVSRCTTPNTTAAVVIVAGIGSTQNYLGAREFASLKVLKQDRPVRVQRNGAIDEISVHDLVVGDIVEIAAGDILAADGALFESHRVGIDEAPITGESAVVHKHDDAVVYGGTTVVEGYGRMLVACVGAESQYGRIAKIVQEKTPPRTPLELKLDDLADLVGWAGLGVGTLTSITLTVLWALQQDDLVAAFDWRILTKFLVVGLVLVVVAVPEGLPLAVTISLQFSMQRMVADKILVREMKACETSGSASVICSDKTGTLTENKMSVAEGWFAGASGVGRHGLSAVVKALHADTFEELCVAIACNSTAVINTDSDGASKVVGNATEAAMLAFFTQHGQDVQAQRAAYAAVWRAPFDSATKRMLTVVQLESGDYAVYMKGAPEQLLEVCTDVMDASGAEAELGEVEKQDKLRTVSGMAARGLRTIAVCRQIISAEDAAEGLGVPLEGGDAGAIEAAWEAALQNGAFEGGFTLLSLFGIADPIRPEVPDAVLQCQAAGIRVVMVTGDNELTARTIAKQAHILHSGGVVMLGHDFRALSEEQRQAIAPKLQVLARSSPTDKLLLVEALGALGEVVSVTGDGTNDAPALRAAHVGLSMGITGTEVAKEASDIVILDDNFASIVQGIKWGRAIVENVRKFLQFQLTVNVSACLLTFVVACLNEGDASKFPINSVELLWVNLIMDSFAALALATEPPREDLLKRKPEPQGKALITPLMWKHVLGQGLFQTALLLLLTLHPQAHTFLHAAEHSGLQHNTMIFNIFVWCQVWNMFNCRRVHDESDVFADVLSSKLLTSIVMVIVLGQFVIVTFCGELASTVPLSFDQWVLSIVVGASAVPLGSILRSL